MFFLKIKDFNFLFNFLLCVKFKFLIKSVLCLRLITIYYFTENKCLICIKDIKENCEEKNLILRFKTITCDITTEKCSKTNKKLL